MIFVRKTSDFFENSEFQAKKDDINMGKFYTLLHPAPKTLAATPAAFVRQIKDARGR